MCALTCLHFTKIIYIFILEKVLISITVDYILNVNSVQIVFFKYFLK